MKWAILERNMDFSGLSYGVYEKTVLSGMSFIIPVLTVIYTSFVKIFCQNLVKKNRKYVARFSPLNADIECQ